MTTAWAPVWAVDTSITTATGLGADTFGRRGNNNDESTNASLVIKNQSGENPSDSGINNDRVAFLKFDISSLATHIAAASLHLTVSSANSFKTGESLFLYGISDGAGGENFSAAALRFGNSPYTTGPSTLTPTRPANDFTANNVNDVLTPFLGSVQFSADTGVGSSIHFDTVALASFLRSDTNGFASFILTLSQSNTGATPALFSAQHAAAAQRPTLVIEGEAIPEPAAVAMLSIGGLLLAQRRA